MPPRVLGPRARCLYDLLLREGRLSSDLNIILIRLQPQLAPYLEDLARQLGVCWLHLVLIGAPHAHGLPVVIALDKLSCRVGGRQLIFF